MEHFNNPWLREGATVYQLMHHGWRKGVETFRNAFSFHVSVDIGSGYIDEELAQRISACVNACAGIADPEQFINDARSYSHETVSAIVRQRDELLAALEHLLAGSLSLPRFAEEQARSAIEHAKGA